MPCIILTGHPCSGKTTLAAKIRERALAHSSGRIRTVVIVNEQSACPDSNSNVAACYATPASEKKTRGALKSAFDRAVASSSSSSSGSADSTLIILDSTNYIKGYRYELYCISKAASTSHCVVWCLNDVATVKEWNQTRKQTQAQESQDPDNVHNYSYYYSDELLDALISRYEPPDERNRWDRPLYRIDLRPATADAGATLQQMQTDIAEHVLDRSVYNMHNLSEAIRTLGSAGGEASSQGCAVESSGGATLLSEDKVIAPAAAETKSARAPPRRKSAFKRNAVAAASDRQRQQQAPFPVKPTTGTLTAEALSSLATAATAAAESQEAAEAPGTNTTSSAAVPPEPATAAVPAVNNKRPVAAAAVQAQLPPPLPPRSTLEEQIDALLDQFLLNVRALREGTSTRQQHQQHHVARTDPNALHSVDSVTQQLCSAIVLAAAQKQEEEMGGGSNNNNTQSYSAASSSSSGTPGPKFRRLVPVVFRGETLFLDLPREAAATPQQLRRIREQYIQWVAAHPPDDAIEHGERGIALSFLSYIEATTTQR